MYNFAVGIPTINRADLLNEALAVYAKCWPSLTIYILDNGNQNIVTQSPKQIVLKSSTNMGVAASWNFLAEKSFSEGFLRVLMLNDDIILDRDEHELHLRLNKYSDHELILQDGTWCSFILPKVVYDMVGPFDEDFYPAYFEDNDYEYRIKLDEHCDVQIDSVLNPTTYRNSMTIQKDPTLNKDFQANQDRYVRKWGGKPSYEWYKKPFQGRYE